MRGGPDQMESDGYDLKKLGVDFTALRDHDLSTAGLDQAALGQ